MDWFNKVWYEKIFDGVFILAFSIGAGFVLRFIATLFKKAKINPTVNVNEKGQVSGLSLIGTDSTKPVEQNPLTLMFIQEMQKTNDEMKKMIEDLKLNIKQKTEENYTLTQMLEEVKGRLKTLETKILVDEKISQYREFNRIPMNQHIVFGTLKDMIYAGVKLDERYEKDITKKYKLEIAKIFIEKIKCKVFYDGLLKYVESFSDLDDTQALQLVGAMPEYIQMWCDEYNKIARDFTIELSDGRVFKGVPECFLSKFDIWHTPHVDMIFYKIRDIIHSSFYGTWQFKLILILDVIETAFYLTKKDAEKTIDSLNGDLEKEIEFKLSVNKEGLR